MPRTELNISAVDLTQFAPSLDQVTITFDPANPRDFNQYVLEVVDNQNRVVFQRVYDGWRAGVMWDGQGDPAAPLNPTRYVNPLGAPYQIRLFGQNTRVGQNLPRPFAAFLKTVGDTKDTLSSLVAEARGVVPPITVHTLNVLYHSIEISIGHWLPQEEEQRLNGVIGPLAGANFAAANPNDPDVILWVWFKLAKLGYFPGPQPVPAAMNDALRLAIFRYRRNHPALHQRVFQGRDEVTFDAGVVAGLKQIAPDLLNALHADAHPRLDSVGAAAECVLTDVNVFNDGGPDSKLYLDLDRFYVGLNAEFLANSKITAERAWTPRPMLPIQCRVYLQDQGGNRVSPAGPGAIGELPILWTWTDRAASLDALPVSQANRPSRTQNYVAIATTHAKSTINSPTHHNTRQLLGGLITDNDAHNSTAALHGVHPYPAQVTTAGLRTGPTLDAQTGSGWDRTCAYLHASIIAGDNFKLTAAVDLSAAPQVVQNAHAGIAQRLTRTTGDFELWRRVRVAAVVRWGNTPNINWNAVEAYFTPAFIKVVHPQRTMLLSDVQAGGRAALAGQFQTMTASKYIPNEDANIASEFMQFDPSYVFPFDPRSPEFRALAQHGQAQFTSVVNIINEVMVGSLAHGLEKWRKAQMGGAPADSLKNRFAMLALWANGAQPQWLQNVAQHFQTEYARICNLQGAPVAATARAARVIAPLPHTANLPNLPGSRVAILEAMVRAPWAIAAVPAPADVATVRKFLNQLRLDVEASRKAFEGNDMGVDSIVHPVLERLARHYGTWAKPPHNVAPPAPAPLALPARIEADDDARFRRCIAGEQNYRLRDRVNTLTGSLFQQATPELYDIARTDPALINGAPPRPGAGMVILYMRAHPRPAAIDVGAPNDLPDPTYGTSIGLDDGLSICCADLVMDQDNLIAHEMAHSLFLRHWQDSADVIKGGWSYPEDHDRADANCAMSYSNWLSASKYGPRDPCDSHYRVDRYRPAFCGKCNLRLRGWDVHAQHNGAPLLPASSTVLTLVEPMHAYTQVTNGAPYRVPDPATLQARMEDLLNNELAIPFVRRMTLDQNTLVMLANPALETNAGVTKFKWTPAPTADAVTGAPVAVAAGSEFKCGAPASGGPPRTVAQILAAGNTDYKSAWEENHEYLFLNGGATNLDAQKPHGGSMAIQSHYFLGGPDVPVHEIVHVYQQWDDGASLMEGFTEVFTTMLAARYFNAPPFPGAGVTVKLNPSYIQFAHFVFEELYPRVGWHAIADCYFSNNFGAIAGALRPGASYDDFKKAAPALKGSHDPQPLTALLGPLPLNPPAPPGHLPPAADNAFQAGLQTYNQYLATNAARLNLTGAPSVLVARAIRLDNVIRAYDSAIQSAIGFRPQVTATDRIHRLESWIEETQLQVVKLRDKMPR